MTDHTTLTEFLLARIAEDEAIAWRMTSAPYWNIDTPDKASFIHFLDYDRILAECEAKRRIVERHHVREVSPSCAECGGYTATADSVSGIVHHGYAIPWPCPTLKFLVLPYADHPSYRPEWAL